MSVFKRWADFLDNPSGRQQDPDQGASTTQKHVDRRLAPPITLRQIKTALLDSDDEWKPEGQSDTDTKTELASLDCTNGADTVEDILQAIQTYLHTEIQAELDKVDWSPEFKYEKVIQRPTGTKLPIFSSAEELHAISDAGELTIPVQHLGMPIDREMMGRIRAGLGPRPAQIEDLVGKLRVEPRHLESEDDPCVESYDEILKVLTSWNESTGAVSDLPSKRQALLITLRERRRLIDEIQSKRRHMKLAPYTSPTELIQSRRQWERDLAKQWRHLGRALQAFRPELRSFENQNVLDQLVITVANQGIAIPSLDAEVKDSVIETLFQEQHLRVCFEKDDSVRKTKSERDAGQARHPRNEAELQEALDRERKASWNEAAQETRTAIMCARNNMTDKVLQDLQALATAHAGLMWAASAMVQVAPVDLFPLCMRNENHIRRLLVDWEARMGEALDPSTAWMQRMRQLVFDNKRQARKLQGLDLEPDKRREVMERRKRDPRTPLIRTEVKKQGQMVQELSRRVYAGMDEVDGWLDSITEAAGTMQRGYAAVLVGVDDCEDEGDGEGVEDGEDGESVVVD